MKHKFLYSSKKLTPSNEKKFLHLSRRKTISWDDKETLYALKLGRPWKISYSSGRGNDFFKQKNIYSEEKIILFTNAA